MIFDGDISKNELVSWVLITGFLWSLPISWFFLAFPWTIYAAWFIYSQFYNVKWIKTNGKVVYITGCDSGFGKAAAMELAQAGFTVCAGCLNTKNCKDLEDTPNVHILDLDVTDQSKVDQCAEIVKELCAQKGLWALYNNAGYATAGEIEWTPLEVYFGQMDVHMWGTLRVTKSVLPLIRKEKGRILTVVSGIARPGYLGRSPYSVSKGALETFMDCLRYEMIKFGVKCITLQPGNFTGATKVFASMEKQVKSTLDGIPPDVREDYGEEYLKEFYANTIQKYQASADPSIAPVDPVVRDIKHAIMSESPRRRYKPAQFGWFVWWFCYNILPEQLTDLYVQYTHLRKFPKPASMIRKQAE